MAGEMNGRLERHYSGTVVRALLDLLPETVKHFLAGRAVQLALQLLQGDGHNMVVVGSCKSWIRRDLEPDLVKQVQILGPESRQMRTEGVFPGDAARETNFHDQPRPRFWKAFPGISGQLGLFIGSELVGSTADD